MSYERDPFDTDSGPADLREPQTIPHGFEEGIREMQAMVAERTHKECNARIAELESDLVDTRAEMQTVYDANNGLLRIQEEDTAHVAELETQLDITDRVNERLRRVYRKDTETEKARADALQAQLERLHSWDGLMELLDEHWPAGMIPTTEGDVESRDVGPRIVSLIRWNAGLRAQLAATEQLLAGTNLRWNQTIAIYDVASAQLAEANKVIDAILEVRQARKCQLPDFDSYRELSG